MAWVVVITNGLAGVWALLALKQSRLNSRPLWWLTSAAYGLVFVQIAVGVAVLQSSDQPAPSFHVLYGISAALAVAVLYGYRHQVANRRLVFFGLGSLFIMGLAIRAMIV